MGALLYLPEAWTSDPARRATARIPAAGRLSGEVAPRADAGAPHAGGRPDPDGGRRRCRIRRQQHGPPDAASAAPAVCVGHLADADGLSRHAHAARRSHATAAAQSPRGLARSGRRSASARSATRLPARAWRRVDVAQRHQSAVGSRLRRPARHAGDRLAAATARPRNLAAVRARARARPDAASTTSSRCPRPPRWRSSSGLAHHRWAIEQHYQDFKSELGLDHFEGRTYPGWQHHMVISAVAYAFLQTERRRPRDGPRSRFRRSAPSSRDLHRAAVYQSPSIHAVDEASGTAVSSTADLTKSY